MESNAKLTSDEKIFAAIAHASALLPVAGTIISAIVWFAQRKRSAYVRFHALQAMLYHQLTLWLWLAAFPLFLLAMPALMLLQDFSGGASTEPPLAFIALQFGFFGMIFGVFGLFIPLGLVGAGACLAGRNFRYPLIGKWLRRYLAKAPGSKEISEQQEDRVVAAVCHSTAPSLLMGLATPLIVWISQKDHSALLRFQALQAAAYQALGGIIYIVSFGLTFIVMFGGMGLMFGLEPGLNAEPSGAAAAAFMTPMLCLSIVMYIGGPLYIIVAAVASIRVARGHDFHYPRLGRFIERRLEASASLKEPNA